MNWRTGAIILGTAVAAFTIGRFSGRVENAAAPIGVLPREELGTTETKVIDGSGSDAMANESERPLRARAFAILSVQDPAARTRQFSQLLEEVTERNWREVLSAFAIQFTREGRLDDDLFILVMDRMGRVVGRPVIDEITKPGSTFSQMHVFAAFRGWAAADSQSATEWLRACDSQKQAELFGSLVAGISEIDARRAVSMLYDRPQQDWDRSAGSIVLQAITVGGFKAAEELYASVRFDPRAPRGGVERLFQELAMRRIGMANVAKDATAMLDWFDPHFPQGNPNSDYVVTSAARIDPAKTFAWLNARSERLNAEQKEVFFAAVGKEWYFHSPDAFQQWAATSSHPQRDAMIGSAVNYLVGKRESNAAAALAATIHDNAKRVQVQALIESPPK